jgi:Fe-S cluster assembly protein SufD
MSSALNKPKYKMIIDNYYNQICNKESLTSLNTVLLLKVYINIPKAKSLTNLSKSCISQLEVKQHGAAGTLIVKIHMFKLLNATSLNENPVLTNSVTEIFAQKTSYRRLL